MGLFTQKERVLLHKTAVLGGPKGDKGDQGEPSIVPGPKGDPLSVPPDGMYRVTNIYVNPETGKLQIEYDDG